MKNLLYVCKYPLEMQINLKNKFNDQMRAFSNLGLSVYYLAYDNSSYYLIGENYKNKLFDIKNSDKSSYLHFYAFIDLYKAAKIAINTLDISYMYVRKDPMELNAIKLYRSAKHKAIKIVTEIPTYPIDYSEIKNKVKKYAAKISNKLSTLAIKNSSLISIIGKECKSIYGVEAINISNGINVESYNTRKPNNERDINILGVASMSKWHGYDRIIKALYNYKGNETVHIHLVGNEGDGSRDAWKKLSEDLGLHDKVTFYDPMYSNELDSLFDKSDIAISSLTHDYPVYTIKSREYMARGIPIITSKYDIQIADNKYVYTIDNGEINMEEIIDFAKQFKGSSDDINNIREYAKENLSWESQLSKILNKLS